MKQLIILSGKKQSGKTTSANAIIEYLDKKYPADLMAHGSVTLDYSFATPLKNFLKSVFGLSAEQCDGTDEQKNSLTRVRWRDLPFSPQETLNLIGESRNISKDRHSFLLYEYENSTLTARELMQIFGSNICRKMYSDCWVQATRNNIIQNNKPFPIIVDCRFPNEIDYFLDIDPIVIRLERSIYNSPHISEKALDNYNWSKVNKFIRIQNQNMTENEKNAKVIEEIKKYITE